MESQEQGLKYEPKAFISTRPFRGPFERVDVQPDVVHLRLDPTTPNSNGGPEQVPLPRDGDSQ